MDYLVEPPDGLSITLPAEQIRGVYFKCGRGGATLPENYISSPIIPTHLNFIHLEHSYGLG